VNPLRIVPYEPSLFELLRSISSRLPPYSVLRHRSFVDHYYGRSDRCRLFLALSKNDSVVATQGIEWLTFKDGEAACRIGVAAGFYSFQKGAGAYLFFNWLRSCDAGMAFGANEEAHRMIGRLGWKFVPGVKTYCLNLVRRREEGEHLPRFLVKIALNHLTPRRPLLSLADRLGPDLADVVVREEQAYTEDLAPPRSAFRFRFTPDLPHLKWRYGLRLPFVRYRLFRILRDQTPVGYVVLQDMPHGINVSHSEGSDPAGLAAGTVRSVAALATGLRDRRMVTLISSHPTMQRVFESVGFRDQPRRAKPLALGTLKGPYPISAPASEWLVNLEWGDRGLRRPFLDEASEAIGSVPGPSKTVPGMSA
jgi:hypothetical protein